MPPPDAGALRRTVMSSRQARSGLVRLYLDWMLLICIRLEMKGVTYPTGPRGLLAAVGDRSCTVRQEHAIQYAVSSSCLYKRSLRPEAKGPRNLISLNDRRT